MLIAIEGMDASGKETQTKLLVERLAGSGVAGHMRRFAASGGRGVERLAFPAYGTATGRLIRSLLRVDRVLSDGFFAEAPDSERALLLQSLMTVNRYEHFDQLNKVRGRFSQSLVLDRYWLSGLVYGMADGLDVDWLRAVHRALPRADLTLYLDISVEESFSRRPKREDAYEADKGRLERVRQGFLACCNAEMATEVNGKGTVEEVSERIWGHVSALFEHVG